MNKCPHCAQGIPFIRFLTGYGSDTLLKHPAPGHPHEHRCLSCRRAIWIHYDRAVFQRTLRESLAVCFIFSAAVMFFEIQPTFELSAVKTVLLTGLVMLFGGVILTAYARYASAVLEEDKVSRRA